MAPVPSARSGSATPARLLLACVTAVGAVAWGLLAVGAAWWGPQAHALHDAGYVAATALWLLMMVAMMLPVLWPWLELVSAMAPRAYPGQRPGAAVARFAAGYFVVWLGYSATIAALQGGLQRLALLRHDLTLSATAAGAVLLVAGVFQLTPLKDACLFHCRNPLSYFVARWDGGPPEPFRLGARHGLFCLGCCWALMALAFVLGLMNLLWMAVLTAMIVAEQRVSRAWRLREAFGVGLALWGVALLLG